jgi:hypothetical protein
VGVTYNIREGNIGLESLELEKAQNVFETNIQDNAAWTRTIQVPVNSFVDITAFYGSSIGDDYHRARRSIITLGDATGEDLEINYVNEVGFGGGFTFTPSRVGGGWEIVISKDVGASSTVGTVGFEATSPYSVTLLP